LIEFFRNLLPVSAQSITESELNERRCNGSTHPIRARCGRDGAPVAYVLLCVLCHLISGCHLRAGILPDMEGNKTREQAVANRLHTITSSATLPELHWKNYDDCRKNVQAIYEAIHYAPAWVHEGQATPQALAVISALENSQHKGLNPEDYDASRWSARLVTLKTDNRNADTVAQFDAALTVSVVRYISNLHVGRLNPKPFAFEMDIDQKHYDLPQFLVRMILTGSDVPKMLNQVEPQYLGYQRTESILQRYLALAATDHSAPLQNQQRSVKLAGVYTGATQLRQRLRLLDDLPQNMEAAKNTTTCDERLIEGVRHFQNRHGLNANGILDKETLRQLNTPLGVRVMQLEDSLERWRWLPPVYAQLPVAVNIPGFRLRVFSDDHTIALRMNVVVGKALLHQTPVFAREMKYIVFRPYWNLPLDIIRTETVPKLRKDSAYLAKKGFEVTDPEGRVVSGSRVNASMLARIQAGKLLVRQKPGASNALGLIKFMFPNEYEIYLHSTPVPQLFSRARRDFSHGCIRVEKPAELAAWLLQDQPQWTLEKVKEAMQSGPDNQQVNLTRKVPVAIVYMTAIVEEDGEAYFYNDIYGHDAALNEALAKGPRR